MGVAPLFPFLTIILLKCRMGKATKVLLLALFYRGEIGQGVQLLPGALGADPRVSPEAVGGRAP